MWLSISFNSSATFILTSIDFALTTSFFLGHKISIGFFVSFLCIWATSCIPILWLWDAHDWVIKTKLKNIDVKTKNLITLPILLKSSLLIVILKFICSTLAAHCHRFFYS